MYAELINVCEDLFKRSINNKKYTFSLNVTFKLYYRSKFQANVQPKIRSDNYNTNFASFACEKDIATFFQPNCNIKCFIFFVFQTGAYPLRKKTCL